MSGTPRGQLRLRVVGGNRIDVAAIGAFDESSLDDTAARLDRLVAGGSGCVHVDCSQIASIDPAVADLFARVRDRLQAIGGTLEISDAPPELQRALSHVVVTTHGGAVPTPPTAVAS
jgi:anti-anti-sigma regulatory factor